MRKLLLSALISATTSAYAQTISIGPPRMSATGKIVPFDSTKHVLKYCDIPDWDPPPLCLIDGKPFFGTYLDREMPHDRFEYLYVTIDGVDIPLDVSGMFNVGFDGILNEGQIVWDWCLAGHEFVGYFEEDSAAYIAHWLVREGVSIRTHLYRGHPGGEPEPVQAKPTMPR